MMIDSYSAEMKAEKTKMAVLIRLVELMVDMKLMVRMMDCVSGLSLVEKSDKMKGEMMDCWLVECWVDQTAPMMVRMMALLTAEMKDAKTALADMMVASLVEWTAEMMVKMMGCLSASSSVEQTGEMTVRVTARRSAVSWVEETADMMVKMKDF